jgi:hypothetical protein
MIKILYCYRENREDLLHLKELQKTSWPGEGKNVKIGKMKPGRTGEFDTRVKNKTFTVED